MQSGQTILPMPEHPPHGVTSVLACFMDDLIPAVVVFCETIHPGFPFLLPPPLWHLRHAWYPVP